MFPINEVPKGEKCTALPYYADGVQLCEFHDKKRG